MAKTTQPAGDWIQTYTGLSVSPLDPREDEICIEDIAHSLALQCRFNGHSNIFYSVAEHCVRAAEWVDDMFTDSMLSLVTLLHDASEAYLCDIPRPIKPYLTNYMEIEAQVQQKIHEKFGLTEWLRENDNGMNAMEIVKYIDTKMLSTESRDLMGHNAYTRWGHKLGRPFDDKIVPWTAEVAEAKFLSAFKLYNERIP